MAGPVAFSLIQFCRKASGAKRLSKPCCKRTGAHLQSANLVGAIAERACFDRADLSRVRLSGANLVSGSFLLGGLAGAHAVEFDHRVPRLGLDEEVRQCPNQRVDAIR